MTGAPICPVRVPLAVLLFAAGCAAVPSIPTPVGPNHEMSRAQIREREPSPGESVTIEADRLEEFSNRRMLFIGRVVAWEDERRAWRLHADRVEVNLDETVRDRISRATAVGNVRLARGDCVRGRADRVEYFGDDRRMVLTGNARLWRDGDVVRGTQLRLTVPWVYWRIDCVPSADEPLPRRPQGANP